MIQSVTTDVFLNENPDIPIRFVRADTCFISLFLYISVIYFLTVISLESY